MNFNSVSINLKVDISQLQRAGLKVTTARSVILELFHQTARRHLSAEDIYHILAKSGEDLGLATIYRVLTQFEIAGILKRLHLVENHSVFELNEGLHHDHIVCTKCGHVDEFMDKVIENRQKTIAEAKGYHMTDHQHIIYGICISCTKSTKSKIYTQSISSCDEARVQPRSGVYKSVHEHRGKLATKSQFEKRRV